MPAPAAPASGTPAALVTGAAGGIGWAICRHLAATSHRVALADIDAGAARARAAELGAEHLALPVDLTAPGAAAGLAARAVRALGPLRVVVNNAGMTDSAGHGLIDQPGAMFNRMIALNLSAAQAICRSAPARMVAGGAIINVASGAALRPLPLRGPYSATKAALAAVTAALAPGMARRGLHIAAVAPGYTRTPLVDALQAAGRVDLDAVAATIPLRRLATPDDIAGAVGFLASDAGRVLNGRLLVVDGGSSAGLAAQDAPARGTAAGGALAVIGDWQPEGAVALADAAALSGVARLAAAIDTRALPGRTDTPALLVEMQALARAVAAHPGRSADFALLFVTRAGRGAAGQAAVAARAMLARTLALEWAEAGIRVNALTWHGRSTRGLADLCRFLTGPAARQITAQSIEAGP